MNEKKKKLLLLGLFAIALIILIGVGATFAYFTATVSSEEGAVSTGAAIFEIDFDDDTDLIKNKLIPSEEKYVDIASKRVDENGDFLKPTIDSQTKEEIIKNTSCIDDNLNEICSMYTFTIGNPMTDVELPVYITLTPDINTFENLYFKVLNENLEEVISATHLIDDRYEVDANGDYQKDSEGNLIKKADFDNLKISPIVLTNINTSIPKAIDKDTPSTKRYTIVMWIKEIHKPQNAEDSNKMFASTLEITASSAAGTGITGIFSATGVE